MAIPLTRLVANWFKTRPGPIYGVTTEELMLNARAVFANYMRTAPEGIELCHFEQTLDILGYRPSLRRNHSPTAERPYKDYWLLPLPEKWVSS